MKLVNMKSWSDGPVVREPDWSEDERNAAQATQATPAAPAGRTAGKAEARPANDLVGRLRERLIIDDSNPYFVASVDGHILYVNDRYRVLAKTSDGTLALPKGDAVDVRLKPSVHAVVEEVEALERPMRYNERIAIGGKEHFFATQFTPVFNDDAKVVAVIGIYRDITAESIGFERANEAQQKFKDFARASADWFWEVDRHMRFTTLSDRFTALTGRPAMLSIGRRMDEVTDFMPSANGLASFFDSIKRRVAFRDQLAQITDTDGNILLFHLSGVPVFDRVSGDFMGYRGAGVEVTAVLEKDDLIEDAKAERNVAIEAATRKNKALSDAKARTEIQLADKDALLSSVALDLRAPIKTVLEIATSLQNDKRTSRYAKEIASLGRDLTRILQKAEPHASGSIGSLNLKVESCALKAILTHARGRAIAGVDLIGLDLSGLVIDTKVEVVADFGKTSCVVEMLLSQAIGRTVEGGGVGLEVTLSDGEDMVNITIWDSGDAESQSKAANDAEAGTSDDAVSFDEAKAIIRHMGGDLTREDTHRKGNCVIITLPLTF